MPSWTILDRYGREKTTSGSSPPPPPTDTLSPSSIASGEAFGLPKLTQWILPSSISSGESFGTPSAIDAVVPNSIASAESFGTPKLTLVVAGAGAIASAEAVGSPHLFHLILPTSITSAESFGTLDIENVTPDPPSWTAPDFVLLDLDETETFWPDDAITLTSTAADVSVTLTVSHGALTLAGTSGLTFTSGDGTSDAFMVFHGTPANINAALHGMTYVPALGEENADELTMTAADGVNPPVSQTVGLEVFARRSLLFNGTTDDVDVPYAPGLQDVGGHQLTFSCWFKLTDFSQHHCLMAIRNGGADGNMQMYVFSNGAPYWNFWSGGVNQECPGTAGAVSAGVWHHFLASYDGSDMYIYLDGVLHVSVAKTGDMDVHHYPLYIGKDSVGSRIKGSMADVRMYAANSGTVNPSDVMNHRYYHRGSGGGTLLGLWRLNDGSGAAPADVSGNGNDGLFEGTPTWDNDSPDG